MSAQVTVAWEIHQRDPQTHEAVVEANVEERADYLAQFATALADGVVVEPAGKFMAENLRLADEALRHNAIN